MLYRLHGTIQPYAWGGHDYIPQLLRREPGNKPAAELWLVTTRRHHPPSKRMAATAAGRLDS